MSKLFHTVMFWISAAVSVVDLIMVFVCVRVPELKGYSLLFVLCGFLGAFGMWANNKALNSNL